MVAGGGKGGGGGGGGGVRYRPPDGGWGWMVMAGSFCTLMVISLSSLGYSILFSEFLLSRGASSTTTAWIFNIHLFLWNFVGVLIGPLTKELGFRRVGMFAGLLCSVCLFGLVFAQSVVDLFIFFPLVGLFGGMACKPSYLMLTLYFDRKRGLANACLMLGVCMAQFVGPLLIRYLLEEYSLKGATLILSGVMLHSVVGASLFQPVEWHLKPVEPSGSSTSLKDEDQPECDPDAGVTPEMRAHEAERRRRMLEPSLLRKASDSSLMSLAVSNIDLSVLPPSCHGDQSASKDVTEPSFEEPNVGGVRKFLKAVARVVSNVMSDMGILRSPRAIIIVLGGVFSVSGYINFLLTAPFAIQDKGFSLSDAAWCMSISAITNMVVRLLISALSDCKWFNIRLAYMFGAAVIATSSVVFGFLTDLTWIKVVMAMWGLGVGITISLYILIMPHFMGVDKMPAIFGVQSFAMSLSNIAFGPLYGVIRDVSNSYRVAVCTMGGAASLCVLLWIFMPAAVAYDKRKEAEKTEEEGECLA